MINYLISFTLCSALLYAVYALLLQNKVIYGFNRFYLLFSICFSLVVPLVTVEQAVPAAQNMIKEQVANFKDDMLTVIEGTSPQTEVKPKTNYGIYACVCIYILIATCLLVKFAVNMLKLTRLIKANERIAYNKSTLVLINDSIAPHSFLNYIFLNKDDYYSGRISNDILKHEQAHISQRHSIDILWIELLQAISWFNPVLILYRRAIRLNHEFLADAAVLRQKGDVKAYQHLLLHQFSQTNGLAIASSFNYSNTKKRLIMMTMNTSKGASVIARGTAFAVLTGAFMLFCQKTQAFQQVEVQPVKQKSETRKHPEKQENKSTKPIHLRFSKYHHTKEGVSEELLNEYAAIASKYKSLPIDRNKLSATISDDKARMEKIFRQMSIEQQYAQKIGFMFPSPKIGKKAPTSAQFSSWKNSKMYGVWINDRHVNNSVLDDYKAADFNLVFVSRLMPNAINYKNYKYQVDLMTVDAYQEYLNKPQPEYLMYYSYRPVTIPSLNPAVTFPKPRKSQL
ncbi:M56 family metallopeptidase [Mucilaginibacter terrae]|uniref:Bla regulator protein BlaR1 n=1 Tax=Mucilaginibacter terrae TaxID=1955052 RepID=A0ABU3GW13_9SPHI|nr:M56 family metallopeptidase [Mucilaginibacter terrae]MDT3403162.1 bla regulator protein BlaR1 [Mucilaginibacter terrae]